MVYIEDVETSSTRENAYVLWEVGNPFTNLILTRFNLLGQSTFLDWAFWEIGNSHLLLEVEFVAEW